MNKELNDVLTRKLAEIESYGGISADDVLSLESLVTEISPEVTTKIRNGIPIHKFTTSRSNINYGEILVNIKSILNTKEEVVKIFNPYDYTFINKIIYGLLNRVTDYDKFIKAVKGLDSTIIEILRDYKFTIYDETLGKFVLKENNGFIESLLNDIDLCNKLNIPKSDIDTFKVAFNNLITTIPYNNSNGDSHNIYYQDHSIFNGNDLIYSVFKTMNSESSVTDAARYILNNILYNISTIPNYNITIEDIVSIYNNEYICDVIKMIQSMLENTLSIVNSNKYLEFIYNLSLGRTGEGSYTEPAYDIINCVLNYSNNPDHLLNDIWDITTDQTVNCTVNYPDTNLLSKMVGIQQDIDK